MWKMLLGFAVFAAIAIFVMMKSGGDVDMSGEKHGAEAMHSESTESTEAASAPASAPSAAEVASAAASAASN